MSAHDTITLFIQKCKHRHIGIIASKELLTSRIGVSAFPHMGSLVLNYIHVGTSTQLLYLFRNVLYPCWHIDTITLFIQKCKHRHIGIIASKELLTSRIGVSAFPHMGSLLLNYIHVGTSAQLLYLFTNVHMATSA